MQRETITPLTVSCLFDRNIVTSYQNLRLYRCIFPVLYQPHYRPEVPRGFQEVKVPKLRDNGQGWW
jgi:hypothetical protein